MAASKKAYLAEQEQVFEYVFQSNDESNYSEINFKDH